MLRTYVLAFSCLTTVVVASSCTSREAAEEEQTQEVAQADVVFLRCGSAFVNTDADLCTASGPDTTLPHITSVPATCTQSPPGPYAIGVTSVNLTCTAVDGSQTATCHERVHVADVNPPVIACPGNQTLVCESTLGPGVVATASTKCGGTALSVTCPSPLDGTFSADTTITCSATDTNNGTSSSCSFNVDVEPGAPVVMPAVGPTLWPPNHKYHTIDFQDCVQSVTHCGSDVTSSATWSIQYVTSDEVEDAPGNGENGDGHTCADMVIAADKQSVDLRAERNGTADGRVYTLHYTVSVGGSSIPGTCQAVVPHDQGPGGTPTPDPTEPCLFCVAAPGSSCPSACGGHSPGCG